MTCRSSKQNQYRDAQERADRIAKLISEGWIWDAREISSVSAKDFVKLFETENQSYQNPVKAEIARRFGPKSSFRELLGQDV